MRCPHCGTDTDPNEFRCQNCLLDRQAPLIWPGRATYAVRGVGLAAVIAIGVAVLAVLLTALSAPLGRDLVLQGRDKDDPQLVNSAYLLDLALLMLASATLVVAGVLFIIWLWRARKNVDAFPESTVSYGPGWAIGSWFVPLANLFIPCSFVFQVVRESLHRRWVRAVVGVWWSAFLLSYAVERVAGPDEPADWATYEDHLAYFDQLLVPNLIEALATAVAGFALGVLVFMTSRVQTDRITRGQAAQVPVVTATLVGGPNAG